MKPPRNSLRQWLIDNDYADVARLIDEIIAEWAREGKRTRRDWWEILAGDKQGNPRVVNGRTFPVLRAARLRQNLAPTKNCLCRHRNEIAPPRVEQERWKTAKSE